MSNPNPFTILCSTDNALSKNCPAGAGGNLLSTTVPLIAADLFTGFPVPPGLNPVLTSTSSNIVGPTLIQDDTGTTPGQFTVLVPGVYRVAIGVDVSPALPGVIPVNALWATIVFVNGVSVSQLQHSPAPGPISSGADTSAAEHLHGEIFLRLAGGATITIVFNNPSSNLSISWTDQYFAIQWVSA